MVGMLTTAQEGSKEFKNEMLITYIHTHTDVTLHRKSEHSGQNADRSAVQCSGAHISSSCGRSLVQQQLHNIQVPAVRCVHQGSFPILSVACGWMC